MRICGWSSVGCAYDLKPVQNLRRLAATQGSGGLGQRARADRRAQAPHQALDVGQVVQREEPHPCQLLVVREIAQIPAGDTACTRRTGTSVEDRLLRIL